MFHARSFSDLLQAQRVHGAGGKSSRTFFICPFAQHFTHAKTHRHSTPIGTGYLQTHLHDAVALEFNNQLEHRHADGSGE